MFQAMPFPIAVLTAVLAALGTGSLFAFSSFVMDGLNRLPPPQAIAAMQSINITAISPLFLGALMGAAVCFVVLAIAALTGTSRATTLLILASALLYILGVIGVTMMFNVPLNNGLAGADAASANAGAIWSAFYGSWQMWNHIRTVAGTLSLILLILAVARMPATA